MHTAAPRYTRWIAAGAFMALLAPGAVSSIPMNLAYVQCLRPVTFSYTIPTAAAADLAQEGIVLEEALAKAGVTEPTVEIRLGRATIHAYAASWPDVERLTQLIELELSLRYPGCRRAGRVEFANARRYGKQAIDVVTERLRSAGYTEVQSGLLRPNCFWVGVQTMDRDLTWAWERRGLFEIRLLPKGYSAWLSPGEPPVSRWRPAEGTTALDPQHRKVNLPLLVRKSKLLLTNNPPVGEAAVGEGYYEAVVTWRLHERAAERMKQITSGSVGRTLLFVWDGIVIAAPTIESAIADKLIIDADFRDEAGRREAAQLAACLKSGPTPCTRVELPEPPRRWELPRSVLHFVRRAYPGCRLLTYDDYGPGMWSELFAGLSERPSGFCPFAAQGDFDGNGKTDWALLLKCREKVKLIALHHAGITWRPHLISEMHYQTGFQTGAPGFSLYLEPVRAGQARGNWELGRLVQLPRDGFEAVFAEKAALLWLWDGRRYTRFVSRD